MKIITEYPIINNHKVINRGEIGKDSSVDVDYDDYAFSNTSGGVNNLAKAAAKAAPKKKPAPKGKKAAQAFNKIKDSGLLKSVGNLAQNAINKKAGGAKKADAGAPAEQEAEAAAPVMDPKTGMSTGAKIGLGLGIAAVVGFIIYKVSKKGK